MCSLYHVVLSFLLLTAWFSCLCGTTAKELRDKRISYHGVYPSHELNEIGQPKRQYYRGFLSKSRRPYYEYGSVNFVFTTAPGHIMKLEVKAYGHGQPYITVRNRTNGATLLNSYRSSSWSQAVRAKSFTVRFQNSRDLDYKNRYRYSYFYIRFDSYPKVKKGFGCSKNWYSFGDNCYMLSEAVRSYQLAESFCRFEEARILSAESSSEVTFLNNLVSYKQDRYFVGLKRHWNFTDQFEWEDGRQYDSSRTPLRFYPLNGGTNASLGCFQWSHDGKVHAVECSETAKFICRRKYNPIPETTLTGQVSMTLENTDGRIPSTGQFSGGLSTALKGLYDNQITSLIVHTKKDSTTECLLLNDKKGTGYRGIKNSTDNGYVCQRWDSQIPNSHSFVASNFGESDLADAANYCRNPNGSSDGVWCFISNNTIVPNTGACTIPACPLHPYRVSFNVNRPSDVSSKTGIQKTFKAIYNLFAYTSNITLFSQPIKIQKFFASATRLYATKIGEPCGGISYCEVKNSVCSTSYRAKCTCQPGFLHHTDSGQCFRSDVNSANWEDCATCQANGGACYYHEDTKTYGCQCPLTKRKHPLCGQSSVEVACSHGIMTICLNDVDGLHGELFEANPNSELFIKRYGKNNDCWFHRTASFCSKRGYGLQLKVATEDQRKVCGVERTISSDSAMNYTTQVVIRSKGHSHEFGVYCFQKVWFRSGVQVPDKDRLIGGSILNHVKMTLRDHSLQEIAEKSQVEIDSEIHIEFQLLSENAAAVRVEECIASSQPDFRTALSHIRLVDNSCPSTAGNQDKFTLLNKFERVGGDPKTVRTKHGIRAFLFEDSDLLYFNCRIKLCATEDGCTAPTCNGEESRRRRRRRRAVEFPYEKSFVASVRIVRHHHPPSTHRPTTPHH